jgi:hypothetical protein
MDVVKIPKTPETLNLHTSPNNPTLTPSINSDDPVVMSPMILDGVYPDIKLYSNVKTNIINYLEKHDFDEDDINRIYIRINNDYELTYTLINSFNPKISINHKNSILIASILYFLFSKNSNYKFDKNDIDNYILSNMSIDKNYINKMISIDNILDYDNFDINCIPKYIHSIREFDEFCMRDNYKLDDLNNYLNNYESICKIINKMKNDTTIDTLVYYQNHKISNIRKQI